MAGSAVSYNARRISILQSHAICLVYSTAERSLIAHALGPNRKVISCSFLFKAVHSFTSKSKTPGLADSNLEMEWSSALMSLGVQDMLPGQCATPRLEQSKCYKHPKSFWTLQLLAYTGILIHLKYAPAIACLVCLIASTSMGTKLAKAGNSKHKPLKVVTHMPAQAQKAIFPIN